MLRVDNQQVSTTELESVIFELKMELAGKTFSGQNGILLSIFRKRKPNSQPAKPGGDLN